VGRKTVNFSRRSLFHGINFLITCLYISLLHPEHYVFLPRIVTATCILIYPKRCLSGRNARRQLRRSIRSVSLKISSNQINLFCPQFYRPVSNFYLKKQKKSPSLKLTYVLVLVFSRYYCSGFYSKSGFTRFLSV
jgi:hypothetical protein